MLWLWRGHSPQHRGEEGTGARLSCRVFWVCALLQEAGHW